MKAILITSDGCTPCEGLREQFADLIARGEVVEKNFEKEPDAVMALMQKYEADIPSLLITTDDGELILST